MKDNQGNAVKVGDNLSTHASQVVHLVNIMCFMADTHTNWAMTINMNREKLIGWKKGVEDSINADPEMMSRFSVTEINERVGYFALEGISLASDEDRKPLKLTIHTDMSDSFTLEAN